MNTPSSSPANSPFKGAAVMFCALLISISGMLAAATSYGNAAEQRSEHHPKHRGPDFSSIASALQLTEEQITQLESTLKSHHQNRRSSHQELRQKHDNEKQGIRHSHRQTLDNELMAFISEDQITQLHEILQKNRPQPPCHTRCQRPNAPQRQL